MSTLPPALVAGTLLFAVTLLNELGLPAPSATAVLGATGAARTTAYKLKAEVEATLPGVLRPPGRPPAAPAPAPPEELLARLHEQVLRFLFDHPGCVCGTEERRVWATVYQLFALELCAEHQPQELQVLAQATGVPLGTLKDWLRGDRPHVEPSKDIGLEPRSPTIPQVEAVLEAHKGWKGGFLLFCEHVQFHLRIPFSRDIISDILRAHGRRAPRRWGRWTPDASALRGGFETFFSSGQWEGDGALLAIEINGVRYTCNFELDVDAHTDAFTGASVRPTEDSAAVIEAFADGIATTGDRPLALLLDNKPSNHAEAVSQALGDTLLMRPRSYQPTDKPHVEGAFGLFRVEAPELSITACTPEQLALQIATLVVTTWARTTNHRPRPARGGKSRVQLYLENKPSEEQVAQAQKALRERLRQQRRAQQTRQRRQDPVTHAILDDAFLRLGLEDPERRLRIAIASWPLDDILAGVAIFEGKQKAGSLPDGVDARYLAGIVRHVAQQREGMLIAQALLKARLDAADRLLDHLQAQRTKLEDAGLDPEEFVKDSADRALAAKRLIDRIFWLQVAADVILDQDPCTHRHLLHIAARRIHSTFTGKHEDHLAAVRFLFAKVVPVQ